MIENNEKAAIKRETNVLVTEKHKYRCEYCRKKYVPKRRRAQKYCSDSCRSNAYRLRKKVQQKKQPQQLVEKSNIRIEKISAVGVGNAALGTAAIDAVKSFFTSEEDKAATKGDLKNLENRMKRYHRIKAIPRMSKGTVPFFNMDTKEVEFFIKGFDPSL